MLLWRLGATLWLFRWIFRDPKVDVRYLALGVVLPDLVDLTIGTVLVPALATGELWFHSLTVASGYMVLVLLATRRGRKRRAFMAVGVAWLFHLMLDGMWTKPEIVFWPFFGLEPASGEPPFWPGAWERAMRDPWRWVLEGIGASYLAWLWRAVGLDRSERRRDLVRTGRIPGYLDRDG